MTLTVGRPSLSYGKNCYTLVELSYLSDSPVSGNERVVLWEGRHPHLDLQKSNLRINLQYKASDGDLVKYLANIVTEQVQALLNKYPITVERGERYAIGYYFLKVTPPVQIPGLEIPRAIAHSDWFK